MHGTPGSHTQAMRWGPMLHSPGWGFTTQAQSNEDTSEGSRPTCVLVGMKGQADPKTILIPMVIRRALQFLNCKCSRDYLLEIFQLCEGLKEAG